MAMSDFSLTFAYIKSTLNINLDNEHSPDQKKTTSDALPYLNYPDQGIWRSRLRLNWNVDDYIKDTQKMMGYLSNLS